MSNLNTGGVNTTKNNFGKWGWSMIIYCALIYYFAAAMSTDGLNIYPEAFAGLRGWDANTITSLATVGGLTAIVGTVLFSHITMKKGSRFVAAIGLILTGIATLVFAFASSWPLFAAASIVIQFLAGSILLSVIPNNMMNTWFPVKKGLALGWASMGMPLCTATFVAIAAFLIGVIGPANTYAIFAVVLIVFGIISVFWLKDSPEDVGCAPDNIQMSKEEIAESKKQMESYKSKLTMGVMLKDKRAWAIGLGLGLMWMTTVGIVSRLIPRLMFMGYAENTALTMLTVAAIFGIFGSYCWGWLDQKLGTRKTSVIYGVWYIIALILLIVENNAAMVAAVVIAGIGIGGIGNLVPSMIGTVYGRKDYLMANKVIMPLCAIIRSCAFVLMSAIMGATGSYTIAYSVFIGACVIGIIFVWLIGKDGDKPIETAL